MELVNQTAFPAGLFRTIIDDRRFAASILARVTYNISGEGRLVASGEQPWKVSAAPWESEYGLMDGDEIFYKGGIDLFVFGHARAPAGRETTKVEVQIEIGSFRRRVIVFGDRAWERKGNRLVPSAPKPFKAIPLTLKYAFGGKGTWDGLDVPFQDNPEGRGYYLDEEHAIDHPLPNIEEPDQLIAKWDDRPRPAGLALCPMQSPSRVLNGFRFAADGKVEDLLPTLFNAAFPSMILKNLGDGESVCLHGVSETGPVRFSIPSSGLIVRLQFDDEVIERELAVDQLGIEVDKSRVFIAYRYPFRYILYPLQRRSCELRVKQ